MGYFLLAAAVFGLDVIMKKHMDQEMEQGQSHELFGGRVILHKYYNRGAALDLLSRSPRLVRCIAGCVLALVCLLTLPLLRQKGRRGLKIGLSLVIGGGANNLYDRIRHGYVVDYFSFKSRFPRLQRIVFNLSDWCIFLGSVLVVVCGFRASKSNTPL